MYKLLGTAIVIIIVGAVSVFAISPYFTESTIDEGIPTGAIIQTEKDIPTVTKIDDKPMMEESMMEESMMEESMMEESMMEESMMEESMMEESMMEESMMEESMMEESMMEESMMEESMMEESMMEESMMEESMMEIIPMSYSGTFIGVGDGIHDAQGDAYTIPLEDKSTVLRLENFKSTNGPDLFVYLSTDENASEFVNLGELKANSGNQNYEIPEDTDLSKYNKVLIWCKAFGVLFGSAELSTK